MRICFLCKSAYNISIRNPFETLEDLRKTLSIDYFGEEQEKENFKE